MRSLCDALVTQIGFIAQAFLSQGLVRLGVLSGRGLGGMVDPRFRNSIETLFRFSSFEGGRGGHFWRFTP